MRGPSHSNSVLPVTPLGREIEHMRLTLLLGMTGDDGDEDIVMLAGSVENDQKQNIHKNHVIPKVMFPIVITALGSMLELADIFTV